MKYLASILLVAKISVGFSQHINKKKILVVPYSRFEFHSDLDIEEIAEKNDVEVSSVFNLYQDAIANGLEKYEDENFRFVKLNAQHFKKYESLVRYHYAKFKGKKYYATDLKLFSNQNFEDLLNQHGADFVLFINWYHIKKRMHSFNKKAHKYSGHYVDYDVYTIFQQRVLGVGKEKIIGANPTKENINHKFLRLDELHLGYLNLAKNIIKQLGQPIN